MFTEAQFSKKANCPKTTKIRQKFCCKISCIPLHQVYRSRRKIASLSILNGWWIKDFFGQIAYFQDLNFHKIQSRKKQKVKVHVMKQTEKFGKDVGRATFYRQEKQHKGPQYETI